MAKHHTLTLGHSLFIIIWVLPRLNIKTLDFIPFLNIILQRKVNIIKRSRI